MTNTGAIMLKCKARERIIETLPKNLKCLSPCRLADLFRVPCLQKPFKFTFSFLCSSHFTVSIDDRQIDDTMFREANSYMVNDCKDIKNKHRHVHTPIFLISVTQTL